MQFSNTTLGFYPSEEFLLEKYSNLPEDLEEVTDEDYFSFQRGDVGPSVQLVNGKLETRDAEVTLSQEQLENKSKTVRDSLINSDLLFDTVFFQVSDDCDDIKSALQEASLLGLEDSYAQSWRLADNSWRDTTIAEAKQIVQLFVSRKQEVWKQFKEWSEGDKTSVFEYKES